jgi:RNA polymerase sigma-70 factor (ECF subfamily)
MRPIDETRLSLLARACEGDGDAWKRLTELYRPLILHWLRRHGLRAEDAEDLAQEILVAVVQNLGRFTHSGHRGAFRSWLRTITVNRTRNFCNARVGREVAVGGPDLMPALQQLEDEDSDLARLWDRQHDEYVVRCLLDAVALEFEPKTVLAFRRLTLDGASGEEVARELGSTVGAVYVAKARVLKRIRQEAGDLLDSV